MQVHAYVVVSQSYAVATVNVLGQQSDEERIVLEAVFGVALQVLQLVSVPCSW